MIKVKFDICSCYDAKKPPHPRLRLKQGDNEITFMGNSDEANKAMDYLAKHVGRGTAIGGRKPNYLKDH